MMSPESLPVAVIGAGPVGLAAAAHLLERGLEVRLFEAGEAVAANVRDWGHVRLFSPWRYNIDAASAALLRRHGWAEPEGAALSTGRDLAHRYLLPLAQTPEMSGVIETGARVRAILRWGIDKVTSSDREKHPFALMVESSSGENRVVLARAVIDASGTWRNPNPLGASGHPAVGEALFADRIAYGIPDLLGRDRETYRGRRVLVVGGGHSAANVLLDLARLMLEDSSTHVTWAVRGRDLTRVFGGASADQLPARGKLGSDLRRLTQEGRIDLVTGFSAQRVDGGEKETLAVVGVLNGGECTLGPFDRIVVATGQRPDLSLARELRLDLDPWLECPRMLGPAIDPNVHSCGTVPPHGYRELAHPEAGYFAVGIKSYGRAPTFLLATGYEQVRSVAAYLAGDIAAADDTRLVLPETGVCTTNLAAPPAGAACCGAPEPAGVDKKSESVCCGPRETATA
jgi:thioredoxin reductase